MFEGDRDIARQLILKENIHINAHDPKVTMEDVEFHRFLLTLHFPFKITVSPRNMLIWRHHERTRIGKNNAF